MWWLVVGQRMAPPLYVRGGRAVLCEAVRLCCRTAGLRVGCGAAVGIGLPFAPGTMRTCPTTRLGSLISLVRRIRASLTLYFAASAVSVSPAWTVTTSPL